MIIYAFAAELTEALRDEGLKQQVLARIGDGCQEVQDDFFRRQSAGRLSVLSREVNDSPLAYLDSAASAQKPSQVIDPRPVLSSWLRGVHRGIHTLSAQATKKWRTCASGHRCSINARSAEELVFIRGATKGSIW
ncbi:aminotransferase class V-fold PLP-dependent enzyme [Shigella flexneri]